ncbi:type I restriction endonuclease subunit R, EcoR124 family [Aliiroseovarius sp. CAU 1755]
MLGSEARLRSKRDLIEEFIESYMPQMRSVDETRDTFNDYWERKRSEAFERICREEDLDAEAFSALIEAYPSMSRWVISATLRLL